MHAPIRSSFRYATRWLAFASSVSLAVAGCAKSGGGGDGSTIAFTPAAMKSVPSVKASSTQSALAALAGGVSTPASIADSFFLTQLFEMQCRHPDGGGVNYCPSGTPAPPSGTFDPYQFTMQALIGFIFHAQMYTSLVTQCSGDGLTPKTVTASSYSAASTDAAANPTRFVLDQFSSYTCRSSNVSNGNAETRMVSAVADGSYQTTLHTRYKYVAGGDPQTDLFQADVTMDAGAPVFLALNFASATPFASRLVLLVNFTNHRFAMKYYTPPQPSNVGTAPERFAVAVGVGGYDLSTGTPNAGNYYLHFLDDPGEFERCVDNAGGAFVADSACDITPTTWTDTDSIATYLGVPDAAAARIAPYLAVFGDTATLETADGWSQATTTDPDLYWPASLN